MLARNVFVFLVGVSSGVACGGDGDDGDPTDLTADFSTSTPAQLRAAIELATGANTAAAYVVYLGAELDATASEGTCPSVTYAGDTTTIAADACVTDDGTLYDGRIVAVNALGIRDFDPVSPQVNPSAPMSLDYESFTIHSDDHELVIDGRIEQSSPTRAPYDSHAQLALTVDGSRLADDQKTRCSARDEDNYSCQLRRAALDIEGLGTFTASGEFGRADGEPAGSLRFKAVQDVRIVLGAGPCHQFEIGDDGTNVGEICWDE